MPLADQDLVFSIFECINAPIVAGVSIFKSAENTCDTYFAISNSIVLLQFSVSEQTGIIVSACIRDGLSLLVILTELLCR